MTDRPLIKGMDLSTLPAVEERGGRFSDSAGPADALTILRRHGMNWVRLRLWNDPRSEAGEPYGAGGCDLAHVKAMARRARDAGCKWLLAIHYSDFWADPGKQIPPKTWRDLGPAAMERAVYDYTRDVLLALAAEGLTPDMTAVGNEITSGLLWPLGRYPDFENIARFVSAGVRAVRDAAPGTGVMLHLDNGGRNDLYRDWFDRYFAAGGADFDVIGLSYYPFWHGPMEGLARNMADLAGRYGKDMIVTETSTGFTLADYGAYEGLAPDQRKGMAATAERARGIGWPMTPEGQRDFLRDLAAVIRAVPEDRCLGFMWWEPAWIPVPGVGWATEAALDYTGEKGPGGNEWANQALFDYEGRALPALEALDTL